MPRELEEKFVKAENQTETKLNLPEGIPPLNTLYLYVSGSCNLACRHCWITPDYIGFEPGENVAKGQHVPLEYVEKAIQEGKSLGLRTIKLTGGEPTIHPQFRELVTLIRQADLNVQIETNGTLVDADLARFLKDAAVSFISISLDGVEAETHDTLRAVPGSFDRAVDGVKNLVAEGFHPQIICTLHKGNVSQVADVIARAKDLGCGSVKFNIIQEMGRGEQFAGQEGLPIADLIELHRYVERELAPKNEILVHFDIPFAFHSLPKLMDKLPGRCGILGILGLLSGGELALCGIGASIPELVYGNIEQDDLGEVWCTSPGLVELRKVVPTGLQGICGECLHRDLCLGSCVANNYHAMGQLDAPYQFCARADKLGLFPASRKRSGE